MKTHKIDNIELVLSHPSAFPAEWIGQSEPMRQLMACWLVIDESDLPLTPRIIGYPGIGKTTMAIAAAQARKQDVYIMQCTSDTRPEDLAGNSRIVGAWENILSCQSPLIRSYYRRHCNPR